MNILSTDRIINTKDSKLNFRNMKQDNSFDSYKPIGLWYALGNEWLDWVEASMPHWREKHIYKIEVNLSKMLVLDTKKKVIDFPKEFASVHSKYSVTIDWEKVSTSYSGIEFIPYFYDLRLKPGKTWYNQIDVPSGCIWKKDAIKRIIKLQ